MAVAFINYRIMLLTLDYHKHDEFHHVFIEKPIVQGGCPHQNYPQHPMIFHQCDS